MSHVCRFVDFNFALRNIFLQINLNCKTDMNRKAKIQDLLSIIYFTETGYYKKNEQRIASSRV